MKDLRETMFNFNERDYQMMKGNRLIRRYKRQMRALAIVLHVVFIIISAFVVLGMLAESVYIYTGVEGVSMQPTINKGATASGDTHDYVYVNTYQKGTHDDIIVVRHVMGNGTTKFIIKRLIGVGGDTITIDNTGERTRVYRNGELLDEPYLNLAESTKFNGLNYNPNGVSEVVVPEGYVFYMGDNRNHSDDCRSYSYTEVKYCESVDNVIGRVDYIIPQAMLKAGDGKYFERLWQGMSEVFNRWF